MLALNRGARTTALLLVALSHTFGVLFSENETHWAFRSLTDPLVPKLNHDGWIKNEIDAFVLQKLLSNGFSPPVIADSHVLLRRLHYGLTGLPLSLIHI